MCESTAYPTVRRARGGERRSFTGKEAAGALEALPVYQICAAQHTDTHHGACEQSDIAVSRREAQFPISHGGSPAARTSRMRQGD